MMTEALKARIIKHPNIDLRLGTRVTGLAPGGATAAGLEAITPKGDHLIVQAQAVILAASGFGANPELVSRYLPELATMPYYGSPFADGDAIQWGQSLGGALDHMAAYQCHSSIAHPEMMLVTTYLINHGAIQVNQRGRRFGDETGTYAAHASAVQSQPGDSVVELFDEQILRQTLADFPRFEECIAAGIVHRAETLTELARHFDLPPSALEKTVTQYNHALRSGGDEFGRTRFGQPLTPPYHAVRVTSALVQTLGGLRVDFRARVLQPDGVPLPGLYAGGGSAAGLAGDHGEGYLAGAGLLAAFGLGWIAALDAAHL
jgi:fumarate reductase flavoprotein subunit